MRNFLAGNFVAGGVAASLTLYACVAEAFLKEASGVRVGRSRAGSAAGKVYGFGDRPCETLVKHAFRGVCPQYSFGALISPERSEHCEAMLLKVCERALPESAGPRSPMPVARSPLI